MHEVREFAGHADIRTTEVYFVQGGRRRGGGTANPDSRDGTQERVSLWPGPTSAQSPLVGFDRPRDVVTVDQVGKYVIEWLCRARDRGLLLLARASQNTSAHTVNRPSPPEPAA